MIRHSYSYSYRYYQLLYRCWYTPRRMAYACVWTWRICPTRVSRAYTRSRPRCAQVCTYLCVCMYVSVCLYVRICVSVSQSTYPPCLIFLNIQAGILIVRIALIVEILDFHNQRESTEAERNVEQWLKDCSKQAGQHEDDQKKKKRESTPHACLHARAPDLRRRISGCSGCDGGWPGVGAGFIFPSKITMWNPVLSRHPFPHFAGFVQSSSKE